MLHNIGNFLQYVAYGTFNFFDVTILIIIINNNNIKSLTNISVGVFSAFSCILY